MIPGSERLVLKSDDIVNINNKAPMIGIAIVTFSAKYLQLKSIQNEYTLRETFLVIPTRK